MRVTWLLVISGLIVGMSTVAASEEPMAQTGATAHTEQATFAGGCFWCVQPPFQNLTGVLSVTSGYTGGTTVNPTYEAVSSGRTGHVEAVHVIYDPARVTYDQLLDLFWRNINPTQANGQFVDHGSQYHSVIFYHTEEQHRLAEASRARLASSGKFTDPIVTDIRPATAFYPAEDYHQDYYRKNALGYKMYRAGSGRDSFLRKIWGSADH